MTALPPDAEYTDDGAGNLNLLGGVILIAGLVLIIFSCFSWLNISGAATGPDAEAAVEITVSGLGSTEAAFGELIATGDTAEEGVAVTDGQDTDTGMPGAWTIAFGVVLVIAGLAMAANFATAIATGVALLFSLASLIATIVFVSATAWSLNVDTGPFEALGFDVSTGWSLWLTFVGAIVAVLAALAAAPALRALKR